MALLLLSEPVPLRSTRLLGDYAEDSPLPLLYGDLSRARFPLIRLSDMRFFVCDHPATVAAVFVDAQRTDSWERRLESDESGHTWTVVEFAAPVPPEAEISATGTGRRSARTGALLESPADVAVDLLEFCGRTDDFSALRGEASRAGIRIAGRISERLSIRAALDQIMQSVGAIWTPGMARLYPSSEDPAPVLDLYASEAGALEVYAELADTADFLRLGYDVSDATGKAQHFIELASVPQRYGGAPKELVYGWIRDPSAALAVAVPVMERLGGARYAVEFDSPVSSIRPGDWVRLLAHPEWPLPGADPVIMVLGAELASHAASVHILGETIAERPAVRLVSHSLALADTTLPGIEVSVRAGLATFIIRDENGAGLAGARCSLDGSLAKVTDLRGVVSFAAAPGTHELAVEAAGYAPFSLSVQT